MTDQSFESAMKEVPLWVFKAFSCGLFDHIYICPIRTLEDGKTVKRFYASQYLWVLNDLGCDVSDKAKLALAINKDRISILYENADAWAQFLEVVNAEYNQPINQQRKLLNDEDFWWLDTDI